MPAWKPSRHPDNYPTSFHRAVKSPGEKILLTTAHSDGQALKVKKLFSSFRASLRNYPLHPTTQHLVAENLDLRLKVIEDVAGLRDVWLLKREKSVKLLQSALDDLDNSGKQ